MSIILAGAILLASFGQVTLKLGMNRVGVIGLGDLLSIEIMRKILFSLTSVGIVLYLSSAALYVVAISREDLTRIYPLISISYLLTLLLGFLFLVEHISAQRIFGVVLIVSGSYFVITS